MKFIHFGCWNNGKCSAENGLTKMTSLLNKTVSKTDFDFITVAGDNYYPGKKIIDDKKVKNFIFEDFKSGFDCLPADINKYVIFGNHDIEDIVIDDTEEKICHSLLLQKTIASENDKYILFDNVINIKDANNLIIMIDTTLYSLDEAQKVNETCYQHIFTGTSSETIKKLIEEQENTIIKLITDSKTVKNIIIIGHHPIIAKVSKKETNIFKPEPGLIKLYKKLKEITDDKKIYHLCADTHFYQKGIVHIGDFKINQYIVGTGGADLDNLPIEPMTENYEDIVYEILEQNRNYGFAQVTLNEDVSVKFKSTEKSDTSNKYLVYKTKYLKYDSSSNNYFKNKYLKYKAKYIQLKKLNL
jgi:hypothetical protein